MATLVLTVIGLLRVILHQLLQPVAVPDQELLAGGPSPPRARSIRTWVSGRWAAIAPTL